MMKKIVFFIFILLISCNKTNIDEFEKIEIEIKNDESIKKPTFYKNKYTTRDNYLDSLGKFINPNKKFQYWQYATYHQSSNSETYTVLKECGDTLLRKKINEKPRPNYNYGIFFGGHPNFRCNYVVTIDNDKISNLKTEEEFRDFLGTIDNLEEAILFARTYGYILGDNSNQSEYRKVKNGFILHLMKYNEFPTKIENIEVIISRDGFIKTKSLGLYCEGEDCYK
jgi:hypothetical protein